MNTEPCWVEWRGNGCISKGVWRCVCWREETEKWLGDINETKKSNKTGSDNFKREEKDVEVNIVMFDKLWRGEA